MGGKISIGGIKRQNTIEIHATYQIIKDSLVRITKVDYCYVCASEGRIQLYSAHSDNVDKFWT